MFEEINERKKVLKQQQQQKEIWINQLHDYHVEQEKIQCEKEQTENDIFLHTNKIYQLKRKSVAYFFAFVTGNLQWKIEQNERKLTELEGNYEKTKQRLTDIKQEAKEIQAKLDNLPNLEQRLELTLVDQAEIMKQIDSALAKKYIEADAQIARLEAILKQTKTAIHLGKEAKGAFIETRALLKKAARWGVFDMLGGRGYAAHKKHQYINEAHICGLAAQSKRKLLEDKLLHIRHENDVDFQINESLVLADFIFDGLYIDFIVQEKIEDAINKVDMQMNEVHKMSNDLNFRYKLKLKEVDVLKKERKQLFIEIEETY